MPRPSIDAVLRICTVCGEAKPFNPAAPYRTKAAGFNGPLCWACANNRHNESARRIQAAPEGRAKANAASRLFTSQNKTRVITGYGGSCVHCGITDLDVLTIDHVNQDGATHKRAMGFTHNVKFYNWLIQNNFPPGFRLLCYNCNVKAFRQQQKGKHARP